MDSHKKLTEASRDMRMYAGSDVSKQAIALLDSLFDCYCQDLINVSPESLMRIQSAIKQVRALRNVFANEGIDVPKI